jgi:tetratricopeptide (TPR) repeat protein
MNASRAYVFVTGLLAALVLAPRSGHALEKPAELSAQCVSAQAKKNLDECPAGPSKFDVEKKRAVAFSSAPPPREVKARQDSAKARDIGATDSTAFRDTRTTRLKARARALLITEIQGLERLFKQTKKNSPDRPQLLRRMAEGYVELESAAVRDQTAEDVAAEDTKKKGPSEAAKHKTAAAQAKKIADAARQSAIKYYTLMKDQYPNYSKLDEVLYYLAYEHEQGKDYQNARKVYLELIDKSPKSPYIPNAYLAFGELFFQEAQGDPSKWDLAAAAYRKVIEYPPPTNKAFGYARYKLGYVYWNKGEYAEALNEFKAVIDFGEKYSDLPNAKQLQKGARRDLIPVYAVSGNPKKAYGFFSPLAGDTGGSNEKTIEMLNELGFAYLDTGHYPEGIDLYRDLMERDKGDRYCHYQTQITAAYAAWKSADKEGIRKEMDRQVEQRNGFLKDKHSDKSKHECSNRTAELLAETAMSWHLEAVGSGGVRGTGDKKTMDLAAYLYKKAADTFTAQDFAGFEFPRIVKSDWPTMYKIKYAMADLLYFQQRWEECGPAFDSVVAEDPKGADAAEAAYASVLCYQKMYDQMYQGDADKKGKGLGPKGAKGDESKKSEWEKFKPKDFTPLQKGMIQAFNRYVCYIKPKEGDNEALEQFIDVKYARARTYFEAQHWEEAALGFRDVALNYSNKDAGIYAAQLYLEAINVLGSKTQPPRPTCYDDMAGDVPSFIELYCKDKKAEDNKEQCQLLTNIQFDVMRLRAEKIVELADGQQEQGKTVEAVDNYRKGAEAYRELWTKYCEQPLTNKEKPPQCSRADEIVYNMAKGYQAGRLLAKSISARKILLDPKYGLEKSALAYKAMYEIGSNYQAIAVYDQASDWFEKYAKETNYKGEDADQAVSDAVVLRLGLGQEEEAIADASNFNRYYGARKPTQAAQIAFVVAAHYGEKKDWAGVVKRLQASMGVIDRQATLDIRVQAHALLARAYASTKRNPNAEGEYRKVVGLWKDPDKAAAEIKKIEGESDDAKTRRLGRALEAVGEAMFFFAEEKKGLVDAVKFPEYKGKNDKESVLKHINTKVKDWIGKKRPLIEQASAEYKKIVDLQPVPPPRWVISSGARVGQMWGRFVDEFRAAPIPDAMKKDYELRTAYYGALDDASEPQKKTARSAFEVCLGYSVKYQYFDEFSRSCEEWLAKNYKTEYHLIDEFRGSPNRVNSPMMEQPRPVRIGGEAFVPASAEPVDPAAKKKADEKKAEDKKKAEKEEAASAKKESAKKKK